MHLPTRHMLWGMLMGAAAATALAVTGPGIVVDAIAEETAAGFDPAKLVRFEDRDYDVAYEPWVSTEVQSTTRIKKVEMGQVSYVDVTTTPTGTYSSDALVSPHVQYPGITVDPMAGGTHTHLRLTGHGSIFTLHTAAGHSFTLYDLQHGARRLARTIVCLNSNC